MVAFTLVLLLSLLALACLGAERYNFDNPYYNRAILDQMDDFYLPQRENYVSEREPALRAQMRFRNQICCGDYVKANMLREDAVRLECFEDVFQNADLPSAWNYFNADGIAPTAQKLICLHQCYWKKRGTFDDRYDRLTGRIRERYREGRGLKEPNMNFPELAVAKCLPSRNPDPSSSWLGFARTNGCNRAYLDFSYCVWEELHADCPAALWDVDNPWCGNIREYLRERRRLTK